MQPILKWTRKTVARDLAIGLVGTMFVVFGGALAVNFIYSLERDRSAILQDATEVADNLGSVLATPMWNINNEELQKIVDVYRKSGIVADIKLVDDEGEILVAQQNPSATSFLSLNRRIKHDDTFIGEVSVFFSDAAILQKQREIAIYSVILFAALTLAIICGIVVLLHRFLAVPFARLNEGLEIISDGDYSHVLPETNQEDMDSVTKRVNQMASEISKRENALEQNRNTLEKLNQAIMDIFSCSDTESLIRTTLTIVHRMCNVQHGWFLGDRHSAEDNEETDATPTPLVCINGHIFEATEADVKPHIGKHDEEKYFSFNIKSRHRVVGRMTLEFGDSPDGAPKLLLKSLLSLADLAMTRQSFIRETAFIAAELRVAETVQQSMLPDPAKMPEKAQVSYHYEPVLRVGGDWFSVTETSDKRYMYLILGDVTGHGLAQGLVTTAVAGATTILEGLIHDYTSTSTTTPAQIVEQLNNLIQKIAGKSNLRMTCVAARFDFKENKLLVCNAGHTFPIRLTRDDEDKFKMRSLAEKQQHMLGEDAIYLASHIYQDAEYTFAEEDTFLFYTDGLTEALDNNGKSFDRKFIRHIRQKTEVGTPSQIKDELIHLLRNHTHDVPVKDDICLLVISARQTAAVDSKAS